MNASNYMHTCKFVLLHMQRPESDGALEEDVAYFSPLRATLRVNSESELGEPLSRTALSYTDVLGRLRQRGGRCVDPAKAAALVGALLDAAVDQSAALRGKVRLVTEGRAARLEVYPDAGRLLRGRLACSVVFVPSLRLTGRHSYVSQPDVGQSRLSGRRWYRTFAVEERDELKLADKKDGGCRVMVLGTLNILRRRVPSLKGLEFDLNLQFSFIGVLFDPCNLRGIFKQYRTCLLYTSPSPRDRQKSRMPSSA